MHRQTLTSTIFFPHFKLSKWIKLYWFLEGNKKNTLKQNKYVLPDGCITILFILEGSVQLNAYEHKILTEGIYIIPPVLKSHENLFSNDIFLIDIHLKPGVFHKLFNFPVNELKFDKAYDFDEVSIKLDKSILERLVLLKNSKYQLLNELNDYFYTLFNSTVCFEDTLINNIAELYKNGDLDSFYDVQNLSSRQIQRKVKDITGLTPKTISRIGRFYNILESSNDISHKIELSELKNINKITDQSHLIKEFKHFTGESPSNFFTKSDNYLQFNTIKKK